MTNHFADLPNLNNILLPAEYDQYIKSFESIFDLINPNLRYVGMVFGDLRLHASLALPVDLNDILLGLDDLADNINGNLQHTISNSWVENEMIIFELD